MSHLADRSVPRRALSLSLSFSLALLAICIAGLRAAPASDADVLIAFEASISQLQAQELGLVGRHSHRWSQVRIDTAVLKSKQSVRGQAQYVHRVGNSVLVEPFAGERHVVEGRAVEVDALGSWTWRGLVRHVEHADFLLTGSADELYGSLRLNGRTYEIQTGRDGRQYVRDIDTSGYGFSSACAVSDERQESVPSAASVTQAGNNASGVVLGDQTNRMIDVLVLYSPASAQRYKPHVLAANSIAAMNASFSESSIDASIRLAHLAEATGFMEPAILDPDAIESLTMQLASGSGQFAYVPALRDAVLADLVLLVFDSTNVDVACGFGLIPSHQSGDSSQAFSVTGDECIVPFNNFAHELGHNMGGRHDSGLDNTPLPFSYSHGFTNSAPPFRTIMGSYFCSLLGCDRLNRWSTPFQSYQGAILGSSVANMVQSNSAMTPVVANYRDPVSPLPGLLPWLSVSSAQCFALNWISWGAAAGNVEWYEIQASPQSTFPSYGQIYQGPAPIVVAYDAYEPTHIRGRSCNSSGCSAWLDGSSPAFYTNGCL